jgi:hypothetical protein
MTGNALWCSSDFSRMIMLVIIEVGGVTDCTFTSDYGGDKVSAGC